MSSNYQHRWFRPRTYIIIAVMNLVFFALSFLMPFFLTVELFWAPFTVGMMVLNYLEPDPVHERV